MLCKKKSLKTYPSTQKPTQLFIAASFITVKTWKQPRYSSVDE